MFQVFLFILSFLAFAADGQASNTFMHAVNLETERDYENQRFSLEQSLEAFLSSEFPVAEGDIRLNDAGVLIMGHNFKPGKQDHALPFKKWFRAILTSQLPVDSSKFPGFNKKGLKMDIKENPSLNESLHLPRNAAVAKVREEIWEMLKDPDSGITMDLLDTRLIIANADIVRGPGAKNEPAISAEDLMAFRRDFPQMYISIGYEEDAHTDPYTKAMLEAQLENARKIGGRIDFNLREPRIEGSLSLIQDQLTKAIESPEITAITVTVWNTPSVRDPEVSQEKLTGYLQTLFPKTLSPGKKAEVYFDLYRPWTSFEFGLYHLMNTSFQSIVHHFLGSWH